MLASHHRLVRLCFIGGFLGCSFCCLFPSGNLWGDLPDLTPEKTDQYAAYRASIKKCLANQDALRAESLLLDMPDVDLMQAVEVGESDLVRLVALGDPDRIRMQRSNEHAARCFQIAAQNHDVAMIRTMLSLGFRMHESYNGLGWAVREGNVPVVQTFIEEGVDVNEVVAGWDNTLLRSAIYRQHFDVADLLLKAKADVHLANRNGWTALHAVAEHGRIDYAKKLLALGAPINARMKSGQTPTHRALIYGQPEFARWLLGRGATFDVRVAAGLGDLAEVKRLRPDPLQLDEQYPGSPSPVFIAAQANQVAVVQHFIGAGLDPNLVDDYGISLLIRAAERGSAEVVKYLLQQKADPRLCPAKWGYARYLSPMHAAASSGDVPTLRALLDRGLPVDWPKFNRESPLNVAAEEGKLRAIRFLVQRGAKIDGPGSYYHSPLGSAISRDRKEVCLLLLELGANPNHAPSHGQKRVGTPPLGVAISYKNSELFDLLLKHGANAEGIPGYSIMSHSARCRDTVFLTRLLKTGVDVSQADQEKTSAIHYALKSGHLEMVRLLLAEGAKIDLEKDSHLAVHAGRWGDVPIMKALLEQGLVLKEPDKKSGSWNRLRSALDAAVVNHRKDMTQFLLEQGMGPHCSSRRYDEFPLVADAAGVGSKLTMLLLIRAGADKTVKTPVREGVIHVQEPLQAALRTASSQGRTDTFAALLRLGAWDDHKLAIEGLAIAASGGHHEIFDTLGDSLGRDKLPDLSLALSSAVRYCRAEAVQTLLKWGADPKSSNVLHELCKHHQGQKAADRVTQIATLLAEHGARLDARNHIGVTAAHEAVKRQQLGLARHLVKLGSPLDLHLAAALGELKFLQQHFQQHGDFSQEPSLSLTNYTRSEVKADDPFGNDKKAKKLNAKGILTWAAAGGSAETVRWLIGLKQFEINGEDDEAPLIIALRRKQFSSVKELLAGGANVNGNQKNLTALIQAADWGDLAVVQLMLDHQANVRQADHNGRTALHSAVQRGNLPVVKLLVQAEVPLDVTASGTTALELAFRADTRPSRKIALFLLQSGADPKAGRGEALFWEVRHGEFAMVEQLLKAGLDPNQLTAEGNLPLLGAVTRYAQHQPRDPAGLRVIQMLLDYGADPRLRGRYDRTPLGYAAAYKYPKAVNLMKKHIAR